MRMVLQYTPDYFGKTTVTRLADDDVIEVDVDQSEIERMVRDAVRGAVREAVAPAVAYAVRQAMLRQHGW